MDVTPGPVARLLARNHCCKVSRRGSKVDLAAVNATSSRPSCCHAPRQTCRPRRDRLFLLCHFSYCLSECRTLLVTFFRKHITLVDPLLSIFSASFTIQTYSASSRTHELLLASEPLIQEAISATIKLSTINNALQHPPRFSAGLEIVDTTHTHLVIYEQKQPKRCPPPCFRSLLRCCYSLVK